MRRTGKGLLGSSDAAECAHSRCRNGAGGANSSPERRGEHGQLSKRVREGGGDVEVGADEQADEAMLAFARPSHRRNVFPDNSSISAAEL